MLAEIFGKYHLLAIIDGICSWAEFYQRLVENLLNLKRFQRLGLIAKKEIKVRINHAENLGLETYRGFKG